MGRHPKEIHRMPFSQERRVLVDAVEKAVNCLRSVPDEIELSLFGTTRFHEFTYVETLETINKNCNRRK